MADPKVIAFTKRAAAQAGADPVAMLATEITEDGARLGVIGDNGTSAGSFQFHKGGALGNHPFSWADTYPAFLNRAQEFARLQVHHGKGAASVQRPADPTGYAAKVDANTAEARRLLGNAAPPVQPAVTQPKPTAPVIHGSNLLASLLADQSDGYVSPLQGILNSNAQLAHIAPITLPNQPLVAPTATPATTTLQPTPAQQAAHTPKPTGKVITGKAKIIGYPDQGTHGIAFNRAGGSLNWESTRAVDIAMPTGTPIYAPTSGVIGPQIGSLGSGGRFAGLRVHLNGGGNEFYFAHLSKLAVKAGQRVQAGQIIGYSGAANGVSHLHLATKTGNPGRYA